MGNGPTTRGCAASATALFNCGTFGGGHLRQAMGYSANKSTAKKETVTRGAILIGQSPINYRSSNGSDATFSALLFFSGRSTARFQWSMQIR